MLSAKRQGDTLSVYLHGEIDHCVCTALRKEMEAQLADKSIHFLHLDFTNVTFMDSSGVGLMIGRYKTMAARGGKVLASGLHPPVDRLFHMAGLHRIIGIEPLGGQENT